MVNASKRVFALERLFKKDIILQCIAGPQQQKTGWIDILGA